MIRPPNPRTGGRPGSVSTSSLQTSTIDEGTLGLSSAEVKRAVRRSRLLHPHAAISHSAVKKEMTKDLDFNIPSYSGGCRGRL